MSAEDPQSCRNSALKYHVLGDILSFNTDGSVLRKERHQVVKKLVQWFFVERPVQLVATPVKQGVAQTGRNRTGPPCSVGRPTARRPTRPLAALQTTDADRRRQTPTNVISLAPTLCVGGPVIKTFVSER